MMKSGWGAWFPAGALHDPLPHGQGPGRYPGSRLKCTAFPGEPSGCVMDRLALTVAGAAQALRKSRTCFPFILGGGKPRRHLKARIITIRGSTRLRD
jgi:hypothetical protein